MLYVINNSSSDSVTDQNQSVNQGFLFIRNIMLGVKCNEKITEGHNLSVGLKQQFVIFTREICVVAREFSDLLNAYQTA